MTAASFVADRMSPRAARRFVTHLLHQARCDEAVIADVALLTSELATNALLHAGTDFRIEVESDRSRIRVGVRDGSAHLPVVRDPSPDSVTGRGLRLVEELAGDWGVELHPDGKTVWFEFELRSGYADGAREREHAGGPAPLRSHLQPGACAPEARLRWSFDRAV